MLKLKFVELRQSLRAGEIGWLTFFFKLDFFSERIFQSALDQIDREIGDVDSDPLSTKFLRRMNRRAASAKWIEHEFARISGCFYNSFEQHLRLLCWVSQSFLCLRVDR
jgi:hypothetical protein